MYSIFSFPNVVKRVKIFILVAEYEQWHLGFISFSDAGAFIVTNTVFLSDLTVYLQHCVTKLSRT